MLIAYQSAEFLDHGLECGLFHGFSDRILDLVVWVLQHFADILCHRTPAALTGVNPNQGGNSFGLQRGVDLIQRDLGGIHTQLCPASPSGYRDESRFFQRTENIADHNGIAAGTFRQKIAGHLGNPFRFVNKYQAMNRNGAFHTDLHTAIWHPFQRIKPYLGLVVTIDFTSPE